MTAKKSKSISKSLKPKSRRIKGNKFTTRSGKTIKVNRTISEKSRARRDAKALRKAERNKGLPKGRVKRTLYKLSPRRQAKYWFSRDGALMAVKISGIAIVLGFFFLIGLFAYFRKDLPNLRDISGDTIGGSIRYYDRTGEILLWEDYEDVKRVPVEADQISDNLREATIALEDRDFYEHNGFNVRGISRAAWNNAFGGDTQGGSTITQQLVKLTTPGFRNEQTVTRKIKELIIAVELERSYSKDEILNGYLNAAPYGTIEYGAEVAARTYFNKSAKDVGIAEAAFLASIPKSPPTYTPHSPAFDKEALEQRQDFTIDVMHELGMITDEERDTAKAEDTLATLAERQPSLYTGILAPHFVLAAKNQLILEQGQSYQRGGWKVITTLDMNLQKIAEEEVAAGISQIERQRGNTAAFVAEDVTNGQVVALVGGGDFNNKERAGEVNFAQEPLPPGSSFKPYDYLALIENTENSGAGSVLYDTQGPIEGYPCTNKQRPKNGGNCLWDYDFRFPGPVTLRYSLGGSRNVPAVKAMLVAGVEKTIETANSLGLYDSKYDTGGYKCYEPGDETLSVEAPCYASSAIGDGAYLNLDKHVHAYATISRNGNKIPQTYILKVEDSENRTLTEWKPSNGEQVIREDSAYIVADMMSDPRASYMSRKNHDYKGWDFSLKTGTTNDNKDGWLMGFSTKYAAGVWVGHHTGQVEMTGFMETMTQPIWADWMQRAHDNIEPTARQRPAGVQELPAYVVRQHVGVSSIEPSPSTDLFPSWYKAPNGDKREKVVKDRVSGKIATECTPPLALEEVVQSDASTYSSDPFYDASTNTTDEDDVHNCADIKPTVSLSAIDNGNGEYVFEISVGSGTHPISSEKFAGQLNLTIDGQAIPGGSIQIGGPGVYRVNYTSIYKSTKTVQVEVTDSVLYTTIDARDVKLKLPPATPPPNNGGGGGSEPDPEED
jgi:membrane peptidoglycan carboxypeptidase